MKFISLPSGRLVNLAEVLWVAPAGSTIGVRVFFSGDQSLTLDETDSVILLGEIGRLGPDVKGALKAMKAGQARSKKTRRPVKYQSGDE